MPRAARHVLPGVPLHIVQRGISGNPCFFEHCDYAKYLRLLAQCSIQFGCSVHAYCLMTNHVHLLVTPGGPEASGRFMKHVGQCYVQTINERMRRSGTLWEGRYYSCLLRSDEYVLACYRYIELNPVRAGMVHAPRDYAWSSYLAHGEGTEMSWLVPHIAYQSLADTPTQRMATYRALCSETKAAREIDDIRRATRLGCVAGTLRRARGRPRNAR
jgi:putative transposase